MSVSPLIGLAVGNTLGFQDFLENPKQGEWGTSTSLALAIAVTLCRLDNFDANELKYAMNQHFTRTFFTPRFRRFLFKHLHQEAQQRLVQGIRDVVVDNKPSHSENDMDCYPMSYLAPVIMLVRRQPLKEADRYAAMTASLTFRNKITIDCCRYVGVLIHKAMNGASLAEVLTKDSYWNTAEPPLDPVVLQIIEGRGDALQLSVTSSLFALKTVLFTLQSYTTFQQGIQFIRGMFLHIPGIPKDVLCAVYGQIAGCLFGSSPWVEKQSNELCMGSWFQLLSSHLTKLNLKDICNQVFELYQGLFDRVTEPWDPRTLLQPKNLYQPSELVEEVVVREIIEQYVGANVFNDQVQKVDTLVFGKCIRDNLQYMDRDSNQHMPISRAYRNSTLHYLSSSCMGSKSEYKTIESVPQTYSLVYLMGVPVNIADPNVASFLLYDLKMVNNKCKNNGTIVISVPRIPQVDIDTWLSHLKTLLQPLSSVLQLDTNKILPFYFYTDATPQVHQICLQKKSDAPFFVVFTSLQKMVLTIWKHIMLFTPLPEQNTVLRFKWNNITVIEESVLFCCTVFHRHTVLSEELLTALFNIENILSVAYEQQDTCFGDSNQVDFVLNMIRQKLAPFAELRWMRQLDGRQRKNIQMSRIFQTLKNDLNMMFAGSQGVIDIEDSDSDDDGYIEEDLSKTVVWATELGKNWTIQLLGIASKVLPYTYLNPQQQVVFVSDLDQILYADGVFQKEKSIFEPGTTPFFGIERPHLSLFFSHTKVAPRGAEGFPGYWKPYARTPEEKFWLLLHYHLQKLHYVDSSCDLEAKKRRSAAQQAQLDAINAEIEQEAKQYDEAMAAAAAVAPVSDAGVEERKVEAQLPILSTAQMIEEIQQQNVEEQSELLQLPFQSLTPSSPNVLILDLTEQQSNIMLDSQLQAIVSKYFVTPPQPTHFRYVKEKGFLNNQSLTPNSFYFVFVYGSKKQLDEQSSQYFEKHAQLLRDEGSLVLIHNLETVDQPVAHTNDTQIWEAKQFHNTYFISNVISQITFTRDGEIDTINEIPNPTYVALNERFLTFQSGHRFYMKKLNNGLTKVSPVFATFSFVEKINLNEKPVIATKEKRTLIQIVVRDANKNLVVEQDHYLDRFKSVALPVNVCSTPNACRRLEEKLRDWSPVTRATGYTDTHRIKERYKELDDYFLTFVVRGGGMCFFLALNELLALKQLPLLNRNSIIECANKYLTEVVAPNYIVEIQQINATAEATELPQGFQEHHRDDIDFAEVPTEVGLQVMLQPKTLLGAQKIMLFNYSAGVKQAFWYRIISWCYSYTIVVYDIQNPSIPAVKFEPGENAEPRGTFIILLNGTHFYPLFPTYSPTRKVELQHNVQLNEFLYP